ncbi:MAG: carbohydrate ABC transporter substrate-binding protein [Ruminococcus sp.]|nr:carbohydrate ABC transporter substrate-binding protein [Ruminococcus sp.]
MAKLKRVLAGALSLCMVGSMLTACGSSSSSDYAASSSKKPDSSKADSSKAGDSSAADSSSEAPKAERKNTAELHGKDSSDKSKNTLRIYCWNTEFKLRFDAAYAKGGKYKVETASYKDDKGKELTEIKKIDGKDIEWVQVENKDGAYQKALDEALKGQKESDNKVDMFLIEADYALKYTDSKDTDYTGLVALSPQDIGITDDDTKNMYDYTKDAVRDPISGDVKALSWQATPGLLYYDVKMAKEVLGTDEPDKVQEFVKDWDTFKDTAKKMKDKGYIMLSSFADTFRVFGANMTAPWVTDKKLNLDPQMEAWIKQTKEFTDNGWNNKTDQWTPAWNADMTKDGKVFCFFMPSWGVDNCLYKAGGDATNGKWKATVGPAGWFWGGSWICGAVDSDNQDIVADIMKTMTCNTDVAKYLIDSYGEMVNNKEAVAQAKDSYKNQYLGGQNHIALMSESADKIQLKGKISAYDQTCVEKLQGDMAEYFKGTASYDDCLKKWKQDVKAAFADVDVG